MSVILATAFLAVQLLIIKTSAQPSLPNAFYAQVSFYSEGYQKSADVYVNYDSEQALMVSNLGLMSSEAGQSYMYFSGSGDYSMVYRYLETFDQCSMIPTYANEYSFPQLNKLENATYIRSHTFMGRSVDVYCYDMIDYDGYSDTIEIAFVATDYTPVYLMFPGIYSSPVIINFFSNNVPEYSRFDLPYQCLMAKKKSKSTKGKAKVNKSKFPTKNIFNIHHI